ncbi:hypothetical protein OCGS_1078 [Oceaniovalibus guishaninsula JLT2003]|uniref:Gluconate 2-dehydrogenase n=1 Tax=Oceaniovalibus guishaninsula JLT2003 TaxID=1231392 RepID=K2I750_9RHOB|nr:gluconate 2-dehydrogenase subunit 3 family protein [Oceaniovalibus guishaninsula]EKE44845.1 hypothetical protein OCGS_1078 [Oceaniovalibus guishaninsula JLT2003]
MRPHPDSPKLGLLDRRGFLGAALGGTAIAGIAGGAAAQQEGPPEPLPLDQLTPEFFTPAEWVMLIALCDVLIPADGDGPGALETRVPVFIDRQMVGHYGRAERWYMEGPHDPDASPLKGFQSPLTPAEIYRAGLAHFQDWCGRTHGAGFTDLDADTRLAAVGALMDNDVDLPAELRDFPDFLLLNVKQGYLSDPRHGGNHGMAAWSYIGFPGARANFLSWTHPDRDNVPYPLGPVSINGERA